VLYGAGDAVSRGQSPRTTAEMCFGTKRVPKGARLLRTPRGAVNYLRPYHCKKGLPPRSSLHSVPGMDENGGFFIELAGDRLTVFFVCKKNPFRRYTLCSRAKCVLLVKLARPLVSSDKQTSGRFFVLCAAVLHRVCQFSIDLRPRLATIGPLKSCSILTTSLPTYCVSAQPDAGDSHCGRLRPLLDPAIRNSPTCNRYSTVILPMKC
jgi:hypothetical protein